MKNKKNVLKLNKNIYPIEAVVNTAYFFIDKIYILLDMDSNNNTLVYLTPKNNTREKQLNTLVNEFYNELLNQKLRIKISKDTKKIREQIVSCAIVSAIPVNNPPSQKDELEIDKELEEILKETEEADYLEDPLGIAVPWEEKYGKKEDQFEKK